MKSEKKIKANKYNFSIVLDVDGETYETRVTPVAKISEDANIEFKHIYIYKDNRLIESKNFEKVEQEPCKCDCHLYYPNIEHLGCQSKDVNKNTKFVDITREDVKTEGRECIGDVAQRESNRLSDDRSGFQNSSSPHDPLKETSCKCCCHFGADHGHVGSSCGFCDHCHDNKHKWYEEHKIECPHCRFKEAIGVSKETSTKQPTLHKKTITSENTWEERSLLFLAETDKNTVPEFLFWLEKHMEEPYE